MPRGPESVPDPVRVKICGLMRREDVLAADSIGADYLGVILTPGFGRSVAPHAAAAMLAGVSATPVAVLVDASPSEAAEAAAEIGAGVVQLHGQESPAVASAVRELGEWSVWKAVRLRKASDLLETVRDFAADVDGILVEGWRAGAIGGSGVRADLDMLESVRDAVPRGLELVLAGGLDPDNVAQGVARFRPSVVDVSSGVEEHRGRKSHALMVRFLEEARVASVNQKGDEH
jgi:phosphoribosylanthranilate isomerase